MIPRLPIRVPIITDRVIGIVLFLGVDPIPGHAIDRDDDTQGDLTASDAERFRGIAEIEGVNYLPGLHHEGNVTNNSVTHVPCATSGFLSRPSLAQCAGGFPKLHY